MLFVTFCKAYNQKYNIIYTLQLHRFFRFRSRNFYQFMPNFLALPDCTFEWIRRLATWFAYARGIQYACRSAFQSHETWQVYRWKYARAYARNGCQNRQKHTNYLFVVKKRNDISVIEILKDIKRKRT